MEAQYGCVWRRNLSLLGFDAKSDLAVDFKEANPKALQCIVSFLLFQLSGALFLPILF
jgi:hypothetical protein